MYSSSPPPGDWNENIPDDETFEDVKRRLNDELQLAAAKLVTHLKTTSFRIRMIGTYPGIYITIGGGRHTDEYPRDGNNAASDLPDISSPTQSQPTSTRSLGSSGIEKKLTLEKIISHQEKYDANS